VAIVTLFVMGNGQDRLDEARRLLAEDEPNPHALRQLACDVFFTSESMSCGEAIRRRRL